MEHFEAAVRERKWTGAAPAFWIAPRTPVDRLRDAAVQAGLQEAPATRVVSLHPSVVSGSAEHAHVERTLEAAGVRITEKHANAFEDVIVVQVPGGAAGAAASDAVAQIAGVRAVAPRGVPRPTALSAGSTGGDALIFAGSDQCSAADAARGATRLDSLPFDARTLANDASGTLVVVWDFAPEIDAAQIGDELTARAGGRIVLYNLGASSQRAWHGSSVASVCCGASAGVARGAALALVSMGTVPSSDLSVIAALLRAHKGPAVVNMSFTIEYTVDTAADRAAVRSEMQALDAFVRTLKAENPRVAFVVAAGNDARDVCSVADVSSGGTGETVMQWPQQRFGAWADSPYLFIGATAAGSAGGRVTQTLATYSNRGACVSALAPGGWWCAYRALAASSGSPSGSVPAPFQVTQGTSFASPATAGLLALVLAARPQASAAEAAQALLANARVAQGVPAGTTTALVALPADAAAAPATAAPTVAPTATATDSQAATQAGTQAATIQAGGGGLPDPSTLEPRASLVAPPGAQAQTAADWLSLVVPVFCVLLLVLSFFFFSQPTWG